MLQPQALQQPMQAPSAVSINIYEPKSYAAPAAQAPYAYTNELYAMPQGSAYAPQTQMPYAPYQQYVPAQTLTPPQTPAPAIQPEVQAMPETAIEAAPVETPAAPVEAAPVEAPVATAPTPEVTEAPAAPTVDTTMIVNDLKSVDPNVQAEAITSIANFTQSTPDIALQVATDPVKLALVDVIKADISALADSTPEQVALADKQAKGEQLTPQEQATLDTLSPKVAALKNQIFSMFTLAMVNKLTRDNHEAYGAEMAQQGQAAPAPMALTDMIGYNEITGAIQNNPSPEVKIAAIQALQYMAKPEDKAQVEQILQPSLTSTDAAVAQTAQEALAKLAPATV